MSDWLSFERSADLECLLCLTELHITLLVGRCMELTKAYFPKQQSSVVQELAFNDMTSSIKGRSKSSQMPSTSQLQAVQIRSVATRYGTVLDDATCLDRLSCHCVLMWH